MLLAADWNAVEIVLAPRLPIHERFNQSDTLAYYRGSTQICLRMRAPAPYAWYQAANGAVVFVHLHEASPDYQLITSSRKSFP